MKEIAKKLKKFKKSQKTTPKVTFLLRCLCDNKKKCERKERDIMKQKRKLKKIFLVMMAFMLLWSGKGSVFAEGTMPAKGNDKYIGELRVETKAKKNESSGGGSSNGNGNQSNNPSGEGSFTKKDSQIEISSGNTLENEFELVNNVTNELSEEQKLLAETFEIQVNKQSEDSNMLPFDENLQNKDDSSKNITTKRIRLLTVEDLDGNALSGARYTLAKRVNDVYEEIAEKTDFSVSKEGFELGELESGEYLLWS